MMKFTATENIVLLEVLAILSPESSRSSLRSWLKEGRVLVDGIPCKLASRLIKPSQVITVGRRPRFAKGNIDILYEDLHLVVIEKPEGLLSVAAAFEKEETIHAFLKAKFKARSVYPVHRLDQGTSGLMLFALSEEGRDGLKKMMEKHEVERIYYAIVEGFVAPAQGTWSTYQFEDANYKVFNTMKSDQGKMAITHYQIKASTQRYTLLELRLETGRKNQIRAHCEWAGFPVAGDKKYGAVTNPAKRLCLHAHILSFNHPITGKPMKFVSPLPEIFHRVVKSRS